MDVAAAEHGEVSVDLVDNVNRSVYHETNDGFFHGNGRFICALSQCVMLLFVSFLFFFLLCPDWSSPAAMQTTWTTAAAMRIRLSS